MSTPVGKIKPRVLISSSVEGLPLAQALQEQLEFDCRPRVWTENVFRLSRTAIESLLERLDESDFAIIVVTPDDAERIRGKEYQSARDNVVLEFALAVGRLGRDRAFLVAPRDVPDLRLPTDLMGIEPASYYWSHGEDDWLSILGPAANRIRRALRETQRLRSNVLEWGSFTDFSPRFGQLITKSKTISVSFIHSRRWRESNLDELRRALSTDCELLEVFLPDVSNNLLREALASHFDDGPFVAGLVLEGYDYWRRLLEEFPGKVKVRLFDIYPTYTFYRFDNEMIVAMYPNTSKKKNVPAFRISAGGPYWDFIFDDIAHFRKKEPLTSGELSNLVARRL